VKKGRTSAQSGLGRGRHHVGFIEDDELEPFAGREKSTVWVFLSTISRRGCESKIGRRVPEQNPRSSEVLDLLSDDIDPSIIRRVKLHTRPNHLPVSSDCENGAMGK
jgi:hypothetical protein